MKNEISEKEFRSLSKAVLPHLTTITQILKDQLGDGWFSSISVDSDGFISFRPYNGSDLQSWELTRLNSKSDSRIEHTFPFGNDAEEAGK